MEYVLSQPARNVWTIVEDDQETQWLLAGLHHVNRIGYLICDPEWGEDQTIPVLWVDSNEHFGDFQEEEETN